MNISGTLWIKLQVIHLLRRKRRSPNRDQDQDQEKDQENQRSLT